jgi:hypothetical protein
MIKNSTLNNNITTIVEISITDYDINGAMIYIIIVLLWYSFSIVFLLRMQMSSHSEEVEDSLRRRTRSLIRNLRDHYNKKEILGKIIEYFNI